MAEIRPSESIIENSPSNYRKSHSSLQVPLVLTGLAFCYGATSFVAVAAFVTSKQLLGHTEHAESLLYVIAFGLCFPLGVFTAQRQLRSTTAEHALLLAGVNLGLLCLVLLGAAVLFHADGARLLRVELLGGAVSIALANLVIRRVPKQRPPRPVPWTAGCALVAVPAGGTLLLFLPGGTFAWRFVVASLTLAAALTLVLGLRSSVSAPRWVARVLDAGAILVIFLLTLDLHQYDASLRYNQDFYLAPVNAVLHGHAMLVSTFSQYGVGVMYFLAAVFKVIPVGYGSFQVVDGILTGFEFVLIYFLLRLVCRSQAVALLATAVCLSVEIFTGVGPQVEYASTGPLRFGLPLLLVLLATVQARLTPRRPVLDIAMLAVLAVSAVWSFETCIYTTGALLAAAALESSLEADSRRDFARIAGRRLSAIVGVLVGAQLAFAVLTRVFAGSWPDWGGYLAYIRLYGYQGFSTLPIAPWSLGYLLPALYFVSVAALTFLVHESRDFARDERPTLTAIAASTAFGALAYTYFLGRSHPNNLHHVFVPGVVLVAGWAMLLIRAWPAHRGGSRVALVGAVSWLAAAAVVGTPHEPRASPLAVLRQNLLSSPNLVARAKSLIDDPPDDSLSVESAGLLDRFAPGRRQVAVVVDGDLSTSTLIRAHRGNLLTIADPIQDALLPEQTLMLFAKNLGKVTAGSVVLTELSYLQSYASLKSNDPSRLFDNPDGLQEAALKDILQRFRFRVIDDAAGGLLVLRLLEPRRS